MSQLIIPNYNFYYYLHHWRNCIISSNRHDTNRVNSLLTRRHETKGETLAYNAYRSRAVSWCGTDMECHAVQRLSIVSKPNPIRLPRFFQERYRRACVIADIYRH